jgi:hypothetical protein
MADSVSRIVPPSVSLGQADRLRRDKDGKNRGEERQGKRPAPANLTGEPGKETAEIADAEKTRVKGKKLDIRA